MGRRPRRAIQAVLATVAGLQVLTGGAAFAEVIPPTWAGLAALAVAAFNAGVMVYIQIDAGLAERTNGRTDRSV